MTTAPVPARRTASRRERDRDLAAQRKLDAARRRRILDHLGDAAKHGIDQLRTDTLEKLRDLVVEVDVVEALFDSRQPTQHGVLTAEAAESARRQHAQDAAFQAERLATGEPLGHGATRAPLAVGPLSVHDAVRRQLGVHVEDATYHLALQLPASAVSIIGPLRVHHRAQLDRPTVLQLVAHLTRQLPLVDNPRLIATLAADLDTFLEATHRVVDGPQTIWAGPHATCPDCQLPSLYVLRTEDREWVVRCLRPPKTRHYAPCVCADPLCGCKTDATLHRHTWRYQGSRASLTSWASLTTRLGIQKAAHAHDPDQTSDADPDDTTPEGAGA